MAALKAQMTLGLASSQNQASLPPASEQTTKSKSAQPVDDDLERLRSQLDQPRKPI